MKRFALLALTAPLALLAACGGTTQPAETPAAPAPAVTQTTDAPAAPSTLSATLEFDVAAGSIVARHWPRHPRCAC